MRLLLKNGRLVDPAQGLDENLDVLIEDGKVAKLAERVSAKADIVLDFTGKVVCPGFIDMHTHLREPGFEYKETIASGTRAAAAGGFTTVCAMANTNPVNDNRSVTEYVMREGKRHGFANVYAIGAVSKGLAGEELAEIGEMVAAGAVAVSDDGKPIGNGLLMRRALEYATMFGIPLIAHAEDSALANKGVMHEGVVATRLGLRGMPAVAEEAMVGRDLMLAELTGGKLHLAHVSTRGAVALLAAAKEKGLAVTGEVTPHHFVLDHEAVMGFDTHAKMNPPLRTREDVEALIQALSDGTLDAIATDHAPHHADEKNVEFGNAPFGVIGLETAVSLALDRLVHRRLISLNRLVELFSVNPARILGLSKGTLEPGSDADVTVLNLSAHVTIDPKRFESKARNTPFAGYKLRGRPEATIVAGRLVWQHGRGIWPAVQPG